MNKQFQNSLITSYPNYVFLGIVSKLKTTKKEIQNKRGVSYQHTSTPEHMNEEKTSTCQNLYNRFLFAHVVPLEILGYDKNKNLN